MRITVAITPVPKGRPRSSVLYPKVHLPEKVRRLLDKVFPLGLDHYEIAVFSLRARPFVHVYTPAATRNFEKALQCHFRNEYEGKPLTGPLRLVVTFRLEKPKSVKRLWPCVRPDMENYLKSVMDAANGVLYVDDAQICECHERKVYAKPGEWGSIEVEITRLGEFQEELFPTTEEVFDEQQKHDW